MKTYSIVLVALVLVACAGTNNVVHPTEDAGVVDAGWMEETDAEVDAGAGDSAAPDAGTADSAVPDAGAPDAEADAGADASTPIDGSADAGSDAGEMIPDAGTPDAGPPAPPSTPVGAAIDVTALNCALDEAGHFWCWQRWDVAGSYHRSEVRYLGSEFADAAGTCARKADRSVWCADFTALSMVEIIEGSDNLRLDSIAELSDLAMGCGLRSGEALCWTDGGSVAAVAPRNPVTNALTGLPASAVAVSPPWAASRSGVAVSAPYDGVSVPFCVSQPGMATRCRNASGWYDVTRSTGTDRILGNGWDCGLDSMGRTECRASTTGGYRTLAVAGSVFHDHAAGRVRRSGTDTSDVSGLCVSMTTVDGAGADHRVLCHSTYITDSAFHFTYEVAW